MRLNNRVNFTGNIVPINVIGATTNELSHPDPETNYTNGGLQCVTDKPYCCRVGYSVRIGEWRFPDGTKVPILGRGISIATTFYRNRGENDGTVNLNKINESITSPTGQFCCEVPDSTNMTQTVCVNISEFFSIIATLASVSIATQSLIAVLCNVIHCSCCCCHHHPSSHECYR